jgi:hypothetical protein
MDLWVCVQKAMMSPHIVGACLPWALERDGEHSDLRLDGVDICNHGGYMQSDVSGMEKESPRVYQAAFPRSFLAEDILSPSSL